jgi:hypothetical protein
VTEKTLIEINVPAKRPDPWSTPYLASYDEFLAARAEGKYIVLGDRGHAGFEGFDTLQPNRAYREVDLAKLFLPNAVRGLKAHAWRKVVVYKPAIYKPRIGHVTLTPRWIMVKGRSLEEAKAKEAELADQIAVLGTSSWSWTHTGEFQEEVSLGL